MTSNLENDGQSFDARFAFDREGRCVAGPQSGVTALGRQLQILRVIIAAAEDDEILESARDEQLTVVEKAEITCSQELFIPFADPSPEGCLTVFRSVPVAHRNRFAAHPDLSDAPLSTVALRLDVDDPHFLAGRWGPRRHETQPISNSRLLDALLLEPRARNIERVGPVTPRAPGDEESRFGQTITGEECLAPKAHVGERAREAIDGVRANRLRAVEDGANAAEIHSRGARFLRLDAIHAQIEGKIRCGARGDLVLRHGFQPGQRSLQECRGWHQYDAAAQIAGLENATDQPHVVEWGQPEDTHVVRSIRDTACRADQRQVVHQIGMREHHALGRRRRAGGVLQHRQIAGVHFRLLPLIRIRLHIVDANPCQRGGGDRHDRLAVRDDRRDTSVGTPRVRRVCGHRDCPGVETAEVGGDVVESRRNQQQRPITRLRPGGNGDRDRAGSLIELRVGHPLFAAFLPRQETIGASRPVLRCPRAQQLDQRPGPSRPLVGGRERRHCELAAAWSGH
jgi:hypothetical protein